MKKTLLAIIATVGLATASNAQIEIYVNGGMTDLAGGTYQMGPLPGGEAVADVHVENHSGGTYNMVVTRFRINEIATWEDYLCWGHETDAFGGTCYSAALMPTNPWTSSNSFDVADGEAGILAAHIEPDPTAPGTVTYRYYVSDTGAPSVYLDSVDIEVSFSLGLTDVAPVLNIGVSPNPASDNITINASGVESANIKIVDVLGNVVLTETMKATKTIDVSDFRNGIYFIIVDAPGAETISRKVIVRH